jgi:hypothetical protein
MDPGSAPLTRLVRDDKAGKVSAQKFESVVLKDLAVASRYVNVIYIHTVGEGRIRSIDR